MPNVKLTIRRVFSYHVSCNLTTLASNFWYTSEFPLPLSCFSLQDRWKRFQFLLDQNLGHFEANLFHHAKIVTQAMLWLECICLSKMAKPDLITCNWHHYTRPPWAPSFIKSRKFPYYQICIHVHMGDPRVPPRVLASGQKPFGGNKDIFALYFGLKNKPSTWARTRT